MAQGPYGGSPQPGYGPPPGYPQQGYPPPPQPPPSSKWYHATVFVVLSLFLCFPLGLILLWTSPKASTGAKIGGTVVVGLLFIIGAVSKNEHGSGHAGVTTTTGESAPTYISDSCLKLSKTFGSSSKLSDLQKEELWKQYKGKAFQWDLQITEVSSAMLGGYTVQAKCAPESPSLIQDVQLSYDSSNKALVMQLQKGEVYKLKGTLDMSSSLLGMTADGIP
jgi:hypothetical protein